MADRWLDINGSTMVRSVDTGHGEEDSPGSLQMSETFILIPGRTSRQGVGISEGKFEKNYLEETHQLQMAPEDMQRLGLTHGDRVRLSCEHGQVEVNVRPAKADELPSGLLFIAYGDLSSRLMGGDTHGSGMPTSKGLEVTLEIVSTEGGEAATRM